MRIDSSGNVGIGTSSPSAALHVDSSNDGPIFDSGGTGNTNHALLVRDSGNNQLLRVNNNGNVGIGTSSPSNLLHLYKASGGNYSIVENTSGKAAFGVGASGEVTIYAESASNPIRFLTSSGGSERMRVSSSGQLLLGTTSGTVYYNSVNTYNLSAAIKTDNASEVAELGIINGNNNFGSTVDFLRTNSAGNDVRIANFGGYADSNTAGSEAGHLRFNVKGSSDSNIVEAARIDASGNLLVGKTSTSSAVAGVKIGGNFLEATTSGGAGLALRRLGSDGDMIVLQNNSGSTVGSIGTTPNTIYIDGGSGDTGLQFGGSTIYPRDNGSTSDGGVDLGASSLRFKDGHFSGTVNAANFNTTSDATLKTNVETLTGSLDAVKSLRGVSFDWIENGNSEVGVIAQEVEAVLPDVVSTNDQGIKSVKYGNMVALLIEAMNAQQLRIEALEAKLGE